MIEERLVEATDEELLARTCKRVLSMLEGVVAGGVDCMLADEGDRVLANGAEGSAPDDLAGGVMMALGA
jgi:hypothetical protein